MGILFLTGAIQEHLDKFNVPTDATGHPIWAAFNNRNAGGTFF